MNFVSENVTAIKNFAEYLMPGEIDQRDELKPGEGGIVRDGMQQDRGLPRPTTASCTSARRSARISAATCTGIRPSNAGTAPATARSSPDGEVLNGPAIAPLEKDTLSGDPASARHRGAVGNSSRSLTR